MGNIDSTRDYYYSTSRSHTSDDPKVSVLDHAKVSSQTLLRWDPERSESRALPDPFASVPGFKILPVEPLQAQSLYLVVSSQAARSPMWDGL